MQSIAQGQGSIADIFAAHPTTELALLFAAALVAGLARGFSGFGGALIFVPLASALVGARVASPVLLIVDGLLTLGLVPGAIKRANRREVSIVFVGALVGVPVGTALLALAPALALRWAISIIVLGLLAFLISGWRYRAEPKPGLGIATGLLAGLFGGVAQVSGPPVVAYWLGGTMPPATVRANLVLYFALASMVSAASYLTAGLLTLEALFVSAVVGPAYGIGIATGARLFGFADERTFRRICFGLIAAAAVVGLPLLDPILR